MISQDDINWKWVKGLGLRSMHHTCFRDDSLGVQMEKLARKNKWGEMLPSKPFFFIDNDAREFTCIDKFLDAYNEKFKYEGENPNTTVKYVRVLINKSK